MPRNLVSGKTYRGANVFLLHAMGYGSPNWLTYKQALGLGGQVRKGEKGCPVVFWKWLEGDETEDGRRIPLLRYYTVFHASQCEGITEPAVEGTKREHTPIQCAERVVEGMPKRPEIRHGSGSAAYSPAADVVLMPQPQTFESDEAYYNVLFHELTHSTGHKNRLARKGVDGSEGDWSAFGSSPYAKEELVAEMGAAFLSGHCGIVETTIDNSAAYVASWLARLKDDRKLVVQAAGAAQKASDFVLGVTFEKGGAS